MPSGFCEGTAPLLRPSVLSKDKKQRTQDERWAWIRSALDDQASGAVHADAVTKNFVYTRDEAEVLIALTAALLRLVP